MTGTGLLTSLLSHSDLHIPGVHRVIPEHELVSTRVTHTRHTRSCRFSVSTLSVSVSEECHVLLATATLLSNGALEAASPI